MKTTVFEGKTLWNQLLDAMRSGEYAHASRLPQEKVLAEQLGISRTQLRDVLALLEQEGFITRKQGVGTIINHHVLARQSRMDIEVEFLDMIRQAGKRPALTGVEVRKEPASPALAQQLQVAEGSPLLRVSRLCTADGVPAIYCEDYLPEHLIVKPYTDEDLEQPIFAFLREFCYADCYLDLTEVKAIAADQRLAGLLQVPPGTPLLYMEETDYNAAGAPVFCSVEYFAGDFFHHTVMRKRL